MIATVTFLAIAVMMSVIGISPLALAVALGGPWAMGWHLAWQQRAFVGDEGDGLLKIFQSNRDAGLLPVPFFAVALFL